FQSQAAWEAMQDAYNQAADQGKDWTFTDAIRVGMRQLGEENLPLNTLRTLQDPDATWTDVAGNLVLDGFVTLDVLETAGHVGRGLGDTADAISDGLRRLPDAPDGLRAADDLAPGGAGVGDVPARDVNALAPGSEVRPGEFGMPEMNGRGFQATADKHLVRIEARATNPEAMALLEQGHPPKPPDLHSKTVNEWDTFLGANSDDVGKVGYFRPNLPDVKPPDISDADWSQIQKRNIQRVNEFADQELHMRQLIDQQLIRVENGVVIDTGLTGGEGTGKAFTGDHDIFRITAMDGSPVPEALREQIIKDLNPYGVEHPAHVDWSPTPGTDMEIDRAVIGSHIHGVEDGGGNALISFRPDRQPVNTFARPEDFHTGARPPAETTFEWLGGSRETP
ncbi:MAG: hypothetical protein AAB289_01800, partial [Chloroflexota bacterium]